MTVSSEDIERRALATGKWASLFMCAAGIAAAMLSRSDALLVDGLYSGVNFASAIIASRVASAIRQPADKRYPFGYEAYESLYVTFRSLTLAGILVFAVFGAAGKILTYLSGGDVPELILGPIFIYSLLMVTICAGLTWRFHTAWVTTGRNSALLLAERRSALIDGLLSAGAGIALVASPLLLATPLAGLVPVVDAVIVLVLTLVLMPQPIAMFRRSLSEVAGASASGEANRFARECIDKALNDQPFRLIELAVTKMGRTYFVVAYLDPTQPVDGAAMDGIRNRLIQAFAETGEPVRCEVVATASAPYSEVRHPDLPKPG